MIETKRYRVLRGENYYPNGWKDFIGEADSLEEAVRIATDTPYPAWSGDIDYYWREVIDLTTNTVVARP